MVKHVFVAAIVVLFVSRVLWAQPTVDVIQRPGAPAGFVANVVTVDTRGLDLEVVTLVLNAPGLVVNQVQFLSTDVTTMPPTPQMITSEPALDFDSYVHFGGAAVTLLPKVGSGPNFGDIVEFDNDTVKVSYFNVSKSDVGDLDVAQLVLGDIVHGSWWRTVCVGASCFGSNSGVIINGVMMPDFGFVIPLPGAVWLGGGLLGAVGLVGVIRRNRGKKPFHQGA